MGNLEGKLYKLDDLTDEDKKELAPYGIEKKEEGFLNTSKINNNWPKYRAVFLNKTRTFCVKVNFLDHLEIIYEVKNTGFMDVLKQFQEALTLLETKSVVANKGSMMVVALSGSKELEDDQITMDCRFAHDQKLGYVTALPKLINEFVIKIDLQIHETMESGYFATMGFAGENKKDGEKKEGEEEKEGEGDDQGDDMGDLEGFVFMATYQQVMKQNKFKCIEDNGKKGENYSYFNQQWEFQQIENKNLYAMSEQQQIQNAINTMQGIFNIYAPNRKFNPYLKDAEGDD